MIEAIKWKKERERGKEMGCGGKAAPGAAAEDAVGAASATPALVLLGEQSRALLCPASWTPF